MTASEPKQPRSALDMTGAEFREIAHALVDEIAAFYDSLPARSLPCDAGPDEIRRKLGTHELPETGTDVASLFSEVTPLLFDYSLHNGHPRFLGYITSSAAPIGAPAVLLAAAGDILGIQPKNQARIDDRFVRHRQIGGNETPYQHRCNETESTGKLARLQSGQLDSFVPMPR